MVSTSYEKNGMGRRRSSSDDGAGDFPGVGVSLLCRVLLNMGVLLLSYGTFLRVHYSGDTYAVYARDDSLVNIRNGRPLGFLFAKGAYLLNIQKAAVQPLMTVLFLLLISTCVAVVAGHLISGGDSSADCARASRFKVLLADLALLILFVNGFFLDWMRFPECYVMIYGPALFFVFCALYVTATILADERARDARKKALRWLVVVICLLLSSWCYQVTLFIYLQLAIGVSLSESTRRFEHAARTAVCSAFAVLAAGLLSMIGAKAAYALFVARGMVDPSLPVRESALSLEMIAGNSLFVLENLSHVFVGGMDSNLPYLLLFTTAAPLAGALLLTVRSNGGQPLRMLLSLLAIAAMLSMMFAVQIISANHDMSARTLLGCFGAISGLLLMSICAKWPEPSKAAQVLSVAVITVVLIAGIVVCRIGTRVELQINEQERWYAEMVETAIRDYENETGCIVTTISRTSDSSPSMGRDPVNAPLFRDRAWSIATYWTTTNMINEYEGTAYANEEMSAEDKERLFGNVNYDSFDPVAEMAFEGDKLYLLVY